MICFAASFRCCSSAAWLQSDNEGLTVAEVELGAEDETFERPDFLGEEVTGDRRYYNSELIKSPYSTWAHNKQK